MRKLSPEFLLAAACCRWPPNAERDTVVESRAAEVDWRRFLAVVRRQRVEGLANDALRRAGVRLPEPVAAALGRAAAAVARENLGFAAESRRLRQSFEAAALPFLFVKGASLDILAYRTLALKRARDIDILVAPEAVEEACALLDAAGYARTSPGPEVGPDRFPTWVRLCKETNWHHPRTGIIVELHSQLVDNAALLPAVNAHSPRQIVELGGGVSLPTLRTEELFAYLTVHGATHAWSRLKWLADAAALLSRFDPAEIERLYRRSLQLGVGRCSAQALLLCQQLLELRLPPTLLDELRADRITRLLAGMAVGAMSRQDELDDTVFGTVPIHLSHFLLGRGYRHKIAELARKLSNHEDQARIQLPRPLHFLYPLISLPSWIFRRLRGPPRPAA